MEAHSGGFYGAEVSGLPRARAAHVVVVCLCACVQHYSVRRGRCGTHYAAGGLGVVEYGVTEILVTGWLVRSI